MKFLADENIPLASITRLQADAFDVMAAILEMPGASDIDILSRAASEQRIILTFDRDFGDLVFHIRASVPAGVAYFRFDPAYPEEPADILIAAISQGLALEGLFSVVERSRIRQRPI